MADPLIEFFTERGVFLDPQAVEHLRRQPDPVGHAHRVLAAFLEPPFHLTLGQILDAETTFAVPAQQTIPVELPRTAASPPPTPVSVRASRAADYASEIEILKDARGARAPDGEVKDFLNYFTDRLDTLTRLLRRRREVANAVPINRALVAGKEVQLIGMVNDISKRSKTGHRFLELEDRTGTATVLVHQSRPDLVALCDTLLTDEVIGVVARPTKDGALLVAEALLRPDLPLQTPTPKTDVPVCAAVLSDIHLGSKTFLRDRFRRMIRWLHAEEGPQRERQIASQIKYLFLPGDIVDGVGVFPGQEEALEIPEVLDQYRTLAKEFEQIPHHMSLVVMPGNHDATRPNEPQPALDKEIQSFFSSVDATFVSNPSLFSLHGVSVLGYHGHSMVDFATSVPNQALDRPIDIMKLMLQCRHLAPVYGGKTPLSPEARDLLVIDPLPDIFVTGHVHVAAIDRYKGIALVNGGTWQAQTSYQKMHNLVPTPCVMPIVNLSTLQTTKVDFGVGP